MLLSCYILWYFLCYLLCYFFVISHATFLLSLILLSCLSPMLLSFLFPMLLSCLSTFIYLLYSMLISCYLLCYFLDISYVTFLLSLMLLCCKSVLPNAGICSIRVKLFTCASYLCYLQCQNFIMEMFVILVFSKYHSHLNCL